MTGGFAFKVSFILSFCHGRRMQTWQSARPSLHGSTEDVNHSDTRSGLASSQSILNQLNSITSFGFKHDHRAAFNPSSLKAHNPVKIADEHVRFPGTAVLGPAESMIGDESSEKLRRGPDSFSRVWGSVNGRDVHLTTIKSDMLEVDVCSLGAALVAVRVNVGGEWLDVVLGYESLERYTNGGKANFGTVVGRVANRVAHGSFELDGHTFELEKNNGPHHIHGGTDGFYSQVFTVISASPEQVTLTFQDADGSNGYPGEVTVTVSYMVKDGELHFKYSGVSDKPTLLSLTNHAYWNLKGHHAGNVLDHTLQVMASKTTLTDETCRTTGNFEDVEGTRLDFRAPKLLQESFDAGGPIDNNFCLDAESESGALAARLIGPNKLTMEVWTDQPGLQVFTGENIASAGPDSWWNGKGANWQQFGAISLEPQLWPDGIHHSHFKSPVLRPGETYKHHSWHVFAVQE